MIKIVKAEYIDQYRIRLTFRMANRVNMIYPHSCQRHRTDSPLKAPENFKAFFLELGALCWKMD